MQIFLGLRMGLTYTTLPITRLRITSDSLLRSGRWLRCGMTPRVLRGDSFTSAGPGASPWVIPGAPIHGRKLNISTTTIITTTNATTATTTTTTTATNTITTTTTTTTFP
ncbi:hypothetical protein E2C01_021974 [Portunus trituberculatus]|uniref:Uncharacterized protein n=1 Tax=Portunus trituberculatus TaxID=210409 RepID=A0A5B7E6E4_PORTR|nr:hypothetical protein [Portunus trituberculatus]